MSAEAILPQQPGEAVKLITKTVEELLEVMEQESLAMMTKDGVSFTAAQDQKQRISERYEKMTEEFKQRIMDFRVVDKALLDKLDALQRQLADKARDR